MCVCKGYVLHAKWTWWLMFMWVTVNVISRFNDRNSNVNTNFEPAQNECYIDEWVRQRGKHGRRKKKKHIRVLEPSDVIYWLLFHTDFQSYAHRISSHNIENMVAVKFIPDLWYIGLYTLLDSFWSYQMLESPVVAPYLQPHHSLSVFRDRFFSVLLLRRFFFSSVSCFLVFMQ